MLTTLIEKLKKVKDYRKAQGTRHPLWLVLLIVILGLMQRNLGYRELENFAKINQKELSQVVKIKLEKLPSYSTIRRVVEGVDWSNLIEIFNEWSFYQVNSNFHKGWKHLKIVIQIERSGNRGKKPYKEKVYYISSAVNEAKTLAQIIKGHWGIENQCHWVKDVIFQEDKSRIRNFQAATNFSTLKTLVINLFRSWGFVSITEGQRWLTDHWHKIFSISELFPLKSSR